MKLQDKPSCAPIRSPVWPSTTQSRVPISVGCCAMQIVEDARRAAAATEVSGQIRTRRSIVGDAFQRVADAASAVVLHQPRVGGRHRGYRRAVRGAVRGWLRAARYGADLLGVVAVVLLTL